MRDLNNYYNKYIEDNFDHILSDYRKKHIEIELIKKIRPKTIVEIGCGINPLFLDFEDFEQLTIIEPADGFCAFVADKLENEYRHLKDKVKVIQKTIQDLESLNSLPDFIMCVGLLGEIPKPIEIVDSIFRISGPDTYVYISAPNEFSFHRVLAKEAGLIKDLNQLSEEQIKFQRFHVFSKQTMIDMVSSAGFKVIDSGSYFIKPFTHKQMNCLIKENLIDENVILGLGRMIKYMPELGAEVYVCLKKGSSNSKM
jgi:2-polyprenyl-3-methyl-5-hydroxy-6-metoxy-1,4-benzoquinol methylase